MTSSTATRVTTWMAVGSLTFAAACGSMDEEAEESQEMDMPGFIVEDDPTGLEACEPGAIPTAPCVDETGARLCPVDSRGWGGDELALCDSGPEFGLAYHYGPKDYDDPEEIAKYTLAAGTEDENCVYVQSTNTEPMYASGYHGRMRPGSHHLIVTIVPDPPADLVLNEPQPCNQTDAAGLRWLIGSQDPKIDVSASGSVQGAPAQPGDPDYGAATLVPANAVLRIDMHYLNPTDEEILREAWIWMEQVPEEEVETKIDMITWFQGLINVPPMSTGTKTPISKCRVPTDRYLGLVTGHFHENGTRVTVWHESQDGDTRKIYETFNWEDPGNAVYADRVDNPPMDDLAAGEWGAESGYVHVKAGDVVSFQCEFDNPTETTVAFGDTGVDQMCNIFGMYYPTDGDVWNCVCAGALCL